MGYVRQACAKPGKICDTLLGHLHPFLDGIGAREVRTVMRLYSLNFSLIMPHLLVWIPSLRSLRIDLVR
jgi:hypothetical protein